MTSEPGASDHAVFTNAAPLCSNHAGVLASTSPISEGDAVLVSVAIEPPGG